VDKSLEMTVASRTGAQALACFIYEHRRKHYVFNHNGSLLLCLSANPI